MGLDEEKQTTAKIISLSQAIQRFEEFKKVEDFDIIKKLSNELLLDDGTLMTRKAIDLQTKLPVRLVHVNNHLGGVSIGLRYKEGEVIEILNFPNNSWD